MAEFKHIYTIELHGVTLGYGERKLVEGASVGFGWGELTALIGRNGTGKSTLLRTIASLARPQAGKITINGIDTADMTMKQIAGQIAFVSTDDVRVQNLHVWDVVSLGRAPYTNWVGRLTEADKAKVAESLRLVGMEAFAEASMESLSDGERQRVMIARALAQDTPIILLDEPTAFLDLPNKYEICLLLRKLAHSEGKCILFSTHDLAIAIEICDTIAMIEGGKFHCGTAQMLTESGELQRLFDHTQIELDSDGRNVRLKK
ncbi:MAG: ABC transporter ATP-binding protein [Tidjanibacter sp.]|jgi:iron complex transport system ATP-binding protein|nr:ABC transporter ATP-binding protein [Tidjanibacter sp.]MBQ5807547.1 ABC transporter ATP-binding protein [Tidjanibacter sp.]